MNLETHSVTSENNPAKEKSYLHALLRRPWGREDFDFAIKFLGIIAAVLLFGMRECRTREGIRASKLLKQDEMTLLRVEAIRDLDSIRGPELNTVIYDSQSFDSQRAQNLLWRIDQATKDYEARIQNLKFHNTYTDTLYTAHKAKLLALRSFVADFDDFKNRYNYYYAKVRQGDLAPAAAVDSVFTTTPDVYTRQILRRKARAIFGSRKYIFPYYQYVLVTFYKEIPQSREILLVDGKKALAVESIGLQSFQVNTHFLPFD